MSNKGLLVLLATCCLAFGARAQSVGSNLLLEDSILPQARQYFLSNDNFHDIQYIDSSFYVLTEESEFLVYDRAGKLKQQYTVTWDSIFHDGHKKFNAEQFIITADAIYFFNHHAVIAATHDLKERHFFMLAFNDTGKSIEFMHIPLAEPDYAIIDSFIINPITYYDPDLQYAFDPAYYSHMPLFAVYPLPTLAALRGLKQKSIQYPLRFLAGYSGLYQQTRSIPHLTELSWATNAKSKQLFSLLPASSHIELYDLAGNKLGKIPLDTVGEQDINPKTYEEYLQFDTLCRGYGFTVWMLQSRISSILYSDTERDLLVTQRTIPVVDIMQQLEQVDSLYNIPFKIDRLKRKQQKIISIYQDNKLLCSYPVTGWYKVIGIDEKGYLLVIHGIPSAALCIYRYKLPE